MPKSRKAKAKRNDVQKKQLRQNLPKGLNETHINFKTRRIVIQNQLQSKVASNNPVSNRKLNLQELLTQCLHYNVSTRNDAVGELADMIVATPEILRANLPSILSRTAELFHDMDSGVRHAALKLLKILFQLTPISHLDPFSNLLVAHLSCAMTSIHNDIQVDSLRFFDVFVDNYPIIITSNSNQLLTNFVELISSHSQDSTKKRTLAMGLGKKLTGIKWQSAVLSRLVKVLLSKKKRVTNIAESSANLCYWNDIQICMPFGMASFEQLNSTCLWAEDSFAVQPLVESLMPVLYDSWIECCSALTEDAGSTVNIVDNLNVLMHVATIIQSVVRDLGNCSSDENEKIGENTRKKLQNEIEHHFSRSFPINLPQVYHKSKKDRNFDAEVCVKTINLSIVHTLCHLLKDCTDASKSSKWFDNVSRYILLSLRESRLSNDHMLLVVEILRKLMQLSDNDQSFITAAVNYCKCRPLKSEGVVNLALFLCDLCDQIPLDSLNNGSLNIWLNKLPELLNGVAKETTLCETLLVTLSKALRQSVSGVANSVLSQIPVLLDHSSEFLVSLSMQNQSLFVSLLWWLPIIPSDVLKNLSLLIHKQALNLVPFSQLITIIVQRCELNTALSTDFNVLGFAPLDSGLCFSFLFSICTGVSYKTLESAEFSLDSEISTANADLVLNFSDISWALHTAKIHVISQSILAFNMTSVANALKSFIELLLNFKVLPVHTVYSCVYLTNDKIPSSSNFSNLSSLIVRLLFSLASWSMTVQESNNAALKEASLQCMNTCLQCLVGSDCLLSALLIHMNTFVYVNDTTVKLVIRLLHHHPLHKGFRACLPVFSQFVKKSKLDLEQHGKSEILGQLHYASSLIGFNNNE